jgi:hypothetical protein
MGLEGVPRQPCVRSASGLAEGSAGHRAGLLAASLACLASRRGFVWHRRPARRDDWNCPCESISPGLAWCTSSSTPARAHCAAIGTPQLVASGGALRWRPFHLPDRAVRNAGAWILTVAGESLDLSLGIRQRSLACAAANGSSSPLPPCGQRIPGIMEQPPQASAGRGAGDDFSFSWAHSVSPQSPTLILMTHPQEPVR